MRLWSRVLATLEGVGIALDAIRSNKVRAGLTIMGVAVGVFVVVGMGAAIHGISESFRSDVNEMGAATFMVRRRGIGINSCDGTDETCADRRNPPVTLAEWRLIRDLPSVQAAVPMMFGGVSVKFYDRDLSSVNMEAYGPQWL
jgi:putative ABC transport system permease protein